MSKSPGRRSAVLRNICGDTSTRGSAIASVSLAFLLHPLSAHERLALMKTDASSR
jgi:hypothetical protein